MIILKNRGHPRPGIKGANQPWWKSLTLYVQSHYTTTRSKLKSELAEVERAMTTALTHATPQEKDTHEDLLQTTRDNILKKEVRLKDNKAKKLDHLQAHPQETTTPPTRGGSRGWGRGGAGRGWPRPSRRTPYQQNERDSFIDEIIEQRRGGRPRRPPRESTHRRRPHGSGGARAQTQDTPRAAEKQFINSNNNTIITMYPNAIIIQIPIIKDFARIAKRVTTL